MGGFTRPISSCIYHFHIFFIYHNIDCLDWISFLTDSCYHSPAAVTSVKYEVDSRDLTCIFFKFQIWPTKKNNGWSFSNPHPWHTVSPIRCTGCIVILVLLWLCDLFLVIHDIFAHIPQGYFFGAEAHRNNSLEHDDILITCWWMLSVGNHHDDVIKWKHFPRYWPFVQGIHRWPVNSPHKGLWRGALMCSLICTWINGWVNNREVGDLRWHHAQYDVTVMIIQISTHLFGVTS